MGQATSRLARCTIQRRNGEFCDAPVMEGLSGTVCGHHAYRLFREMVTIVDMELQPGSVRRMVTLLDMLGETDYADAPAPRRGIVYYLLVDGLVKIGTTLNLDQRLRDYPPTAHLLATEPGGVEVERDRLDQFAAHRTARREWFTPVRELREHIESLPGYRAA